MVANPHSAAMSPIGRSEWFSKDRDGGRPRLGNENDVYMELTWMQAHMLGDSPDVMDVSMTFTPAIVYNQSRKSAVSFGDSVIETTGNDFQFNMRQAFLEMKNVIKSAPEITFWGGQRFYDRFNTDPNDYFWLDTSGYGAGVYNIDVGLGKLAFAYLGGQDDTLIAPNTGAFYKHTFDLRLKDINLGPGTLMLVLIGNFEKGATFTQGYTSGVVTGTSDVFTPSGSLVNLPNPIHTDSAWGIGGGIVYKINLTNNSYLRLWALFGSGATNFSTSPKPVRRSIDLAS